MQVSVVVIPLVIQEPELPSQSDFALSCVSLMVYSLTKESGKPGAPVYFMVH